MSVPQAFPFFIFTGNFISGLAFLSALEICFYCVFMLHVSTCNLYSIYMHNIHHLGTLYIKVIYWYVKNGKCAHI